MATLSPATPQIAPAQPDHAAVQSDQAAEIRIERLFSIFVGAGYLGYLPLMAGAIGNAAEHTAAWWTPSALLLVFGPAVVLLVAALTRHRTVARWAGRSAAGGFVVAAVSFGPAWDGHPIPDYLWFAIISGLAALAAAVTISPRWAFITLIAATIPANVYQYLVRDSSNTHNLLVTMLFFSSLAFTVLENANTYAEAAAAAAATARRSQRSHIDALLHDWVISTMLAAGRQGNTESVRRQAALTLDKLDSGPIVLTRVPAATAMAQLRAGVLEVDLTQPIDARIDEAANDIPADVIDIIDAAICEAVRNSIRHAGPGARRTVSMIITADGIDATVIDDGTGFDPADVAPHRLGLAVSILGRLRALPGGSAEVTTAPGEGTRVDLRWTNTASDVTRGPAPA